MFFLIGPYASAQDTSQDPAQDEKLAKYYDKTIAKAFKKQKSDPLDALTPNQKSQLSCSGKEDRKAIPLYRPTPPIEIAVKQDTSGRCNFTFDINQTGKIENLRFNTCIYKEQAKPSAKEIVKWVYAPKCESGQAVKVHNVSSSFSFKVFDGRGNEIPEPKTAEGRGTQKLRNISGDSQTWIDLKRSEQIEILTFFHGLESKLQKAQSEEASGIAYPILPTDSYGKLVVCMSDEAQADQNNIRTSTQGDEASSMTKLFYSCKEKLLSKN